MKSGSHYSLQSFLEIFGNHHCCVDDSDYARFGMHRQLLEKIARVENSALAVFDTHRKHYLLSCSKFDDAAGYELNPGKKVSPEYFYSYMHPQDFHFVIDTVYRTFTYINALPAAEKTEYKLIVDYRLKNQEGKDLRFVQQMVVLELDRNGEIWLLLKIFDLVSDKAGDEPPQRRLVNLKTRKLHLFNDENDIHASKLLTKREVEVLDLISQGLDSRDISERLFISLNTVNNHRQNILSKTRSGNTSQALLYAKRIGII